MALLFYYFYNWIVMKKTYLTFVLILISISLFAQNGNGVNSSVFKSGEWFQFRIHYGPFNASYATMQLNETNYKGKSVYHVIGKGTTTGLANGYFLRWMIITKVISTKWMVSHIGLFVR